MLVLKRTTGQQIVIAGSIRITVLKVQRDRVELGIEASSEIHILRGELELLEGNQERSQPNSAGLLR